MPLPIAAEIHRGLADHGEAGNPADLIAVRHPAVVLAPRGLLSVAEQIGSGDVVVMADFATAQPAEIAFGAIRACTVQAVGFLMVDALHFEAGVKVIPSVRLVGMDDCSFGNAGWNEGDCQSFGVKHAGN